MQNLLLGVIALLLVLGLWWAFVAGVRAGKSTIVLKNTLALQQGVGYFFSDQNRYPTALEFSDRNIMLDYFSAYPPQSVPGGPCTQSYKYSSANSKAYEIDFCLPRGAQGFPAGWNKVTQ